MVKERSRSLDFLQLNSERERERDGLVLDSWRPRSLNLVQIVKTRE